MSRVVVVTGVSSGVGHATAEHFRDLGDEVFGIDIDEGAPEGISFLRCDVSSKAEVDAAIAAIGPAHGRIDVLANVAGIVQFGRVDQISEAEWDRVQAVDLKGPFLAIQAALPFLRACTGTVVNISSIAGNTGQPYAAAYSAAKGGLVTLTKALAMELAPEGIRVNAICPGTIDTPMVARVAETYPADLHPQVSQRLFPLLPGAAISPAELAAAIAYLASPEARMITGSILAFDGGMS